MVHAAGVQRVARRLAGAAAVEDAAVLAVPQERRRCMYTYERNSVSGNAITRKSYLWNMRIMGETIDRRVDCTRFVAVRTCAVV